MMKKTGTFYRSASDLSLIHIFSPVLITFLGMDPYMAVGIALASDVLASAVSAYTYGKNKNLDIRNGLIMMAVSYTHLDVYKRQEIALEGAHDPDCRRCMPWDEIDSAENQKKIELMKRCV